MADDRRLLTTAAEVVLALAAATAVGAALQAVLDLPDPSPVYLLAVAAVAIRRGSVAAIVMAVGAFLAYNFLFIEPRYTFDVARPQQLVTLLLLLVLGGLIGRLAGGQRDRAEEAARREHEAQALYAISRTLGSVDPFEAALATVVDELVSRSQMERVWIAESVTDGRERVIADSGPDRPLPEVAGFAVLRRGALDGRASWHRISPPRRTGPMGRGDETRHRVALVAGGTELGSLWAARSPGARTPGPEESRLLGVAADQIAQAIQRRRLASAAAEADVARRGDEAKTALLASVSHDLRTPLATIRAAAGTMAEPEIEVSVADRVALGRVIDEEATRLNRLVTNLLDLSRIDGGALHAQLEVVPVGLAVESTLDRLAPILAGRPLTTDLPAALPAVRADPILLDQVITNLVENAVRHAASDSAIRIAATLRDDGLVDLVVEDGGPGVPEEQMGRLFGAFSRIERGGHRFQGSGLGLAIVRGLAAAMGASAWATRSELGGLAVHIALPAAPRSGEEPP